MLRLYHGLFPNLDEADEREIDGYLAADPNRAVVLVADHENGKLSGFVEVGTRDYAEGCSSSPVPYIEAWYVDADVRRSGLGGELLAAAEDWARVRGFTEIASDTESHNAVSIAAHQALGYEVVETIVCFRRDLK